MATVTHDIAFDNFIETALTNDITSSATDIFLDAVPTASQGFLVIDPDNATSREIIFYTSKTATKVVCPSAVDGRGQDGTNAGAHTQGTTVIMAPIAAFFESLQNGDAMGVQFDPVASGVNKLSFQSSTTGNPLKIEATGTDSNIDIDLDVKGTANVTKSGNPIDGFEEIGRTTLSGAGDSIAASFAAKTYLYVIIHGLTSGTVNLRIRFNSDTGSNYAYRTSVSGGADTTSGSASFMEAHAAVAGVPFATIEIYNRASQEKLVTGHGLWKGAAGAATAPVRTEFAGKWTNTTDQITSIDIINSGAGDFAIGAEVIIYGRD